MLIIIIMLIIGNRHRHRQSGPLDPRFRSDMYFKKFNDIMKLNYIQIPNPICIDKKSVYILTVAFSKKLPFCMHFRNLTTYHQFVKCETHLAMNELMRFSFKLGSSTMCDFHDFGLTWKCQKIFPCGCTITSKAKINVVWNFFSLQVPFGHSPFEKISNNVDFSLWGKQCICPAKRDQNCENHI